MSDQADEAKGLANVIEERKAILAKLDGEIEAKTKQAAELDGALKAKAEEHEKALATIAGSLSDAHAAAEAAKSDLKAAHEAASADFEAAHKAAKEAATTTVAHLNAQEVKLREAIATHHFTLKGLIQKLERLLAS